MLSLYTLAGAGFLLGLRHACDADHVVAVSTMVTRARALRGAAWTGVCWGVGHTITIMLVAAFIILAKGPIPHAVADAAELLVGVMLVGLGWWALRGAGFARSAHRASVNRTPAQRAVWLRPLLVGSLHGLAGSASIALLALAGAHDASVAAMYLASFGAGTILGMMSLTTLMAAPLALAAERAPEFTLRVRGLCGVASIGLGAFIVVQAVLTSGVWSQALALR